MDDKDLSVFKVFTPTSPAFLSFIEREEINEKLVNALMTPGKQLVVYGHSGSGKSTILLNKLNQLYDNHITSRCMQGTSFEQLILDTFDQLAPFYSTEKATKRTNTKGAQLSATYIGIQSQMSTSNLQENSDKSIRILPPQLTLQNLARFMGQSKCCWVLEDFHKIDEKDRTKLSQAMKIFVDMAGEYPELKIIAIGAVDSARQVVEYDSEMRTRVAEIHVPLMDLLELQDIILVGAKLMNIKFSSSLTSTISHYAAGLPSICHHLCLNICISQNLYTKRRTLVSLDKPDLQQAIKMYLDEASDSLKMAFENAFKQSSVKKYNNSELIIRALSELPKEGATRADIYRQIIKMKKNYPQGNLTSYLKKLCDSPKTPLIRSSESSGKYAFIDPLYRAFAIALFTDGDQLLSSHTSSHDWNFMVAHFIATFSTEALTKSISNNLSTKTKSNFKLTSHTSPIQDEK